MARSLRAWCLLSHVATLLVLLFTSSQLPLEAFAQAVVSDVTAQLDDPHLHAASGTRRIRPFYTVHKESHFYHMARRHNTDKVTVHQYEMLYTRYLEAHGPTQRLQPYKVLEIGLGCRMYYGAGHSASLWREYFPNAELWFAEFAAGCVRANKKKLDAMNIRVVTGDQSKPEVLRRWIRETGGNFDIIIDDGGHSNMQQFNSLTVLMKEALKPGGIYFLEDLQIARMGTYVDGDQRHVMIEVLKDWLEGIVMSASMPNNVTGIPDGPAGVTAALNAMKVKRSVPYLPTYTLPDRIQSIDCSAEMCAFVKCLTDDPRCPYGLPQGPAEGQNATECGRYLKDTSGGKDGHR